jgi:hypothetical protein
MDQRMTEELLYVQYRIFGLVPGWEEGWFVVVWFFLSQREKWGLMRSQGKGVVDCRCKEG